MRSQKHKQPILLFDRDGTLIREKGYLGDPNGVQLLSGVVDGLKRLQKAGYPLVVVTNQAGVGRGILTRKAVVSVKKRFLDLLKSKGIVLDGYYWCPHAPDAGCRCRKPEIGMVRQASRKLKRTYRGAISVGDRWSDVALGQNAKGHGVLILTGYGRRYLEQPTRIKPDFVARNFKAFTAWVLNKRGEQ
jgi:D-glycero-D-manno-heptose 1,7-bisphosphate phosphatase